MTISRQSLYSIVVQTCIFFHFSPNFKMESNEVVHPQTHASGNTDTHTAQYTGRQISQISLCSTLPNPCPGLRCHWPSCAPAWTKSWRQMRPRYSVSLSLSLAHTRTLPCLCLSLSLSSISLLLFLCTLSSLLFMFSLSVTLEFRGNVTITSYLNFFLFVYNLANRTIQLLDRLNCSALPFLRYPSTAIHICFLLSTFYFVTRSSLFLSHLFRTP